MDNEPTAPAQITEKIAGDIIVAEFNYIHNTAFQANEDRARVSQFFFVTFGTFVAALFTSQLTDVDLHQVYTAFAILFVLLAVFGGLTLLQLTRLRLAWLESVRAMNQIKGKISQEYPHLQSYFRWTLATLPPAYKSSSVGSILALMVALLTGLAIASALAFFGLAVNPGSVPWLVCLLSFILGALISFFALYQQPLIRRSTPPP